MKRSLSIVTYLFRRQAMMEYEAKIKEELKKWQKSMQKKPTIVNRLSKGMQNRINNIIPKKVHDIITVTIKNMVKVVLVGSEYTTKTPLRLTTIERREELVNDRLKFYKKAAVAEGAGTGAGGIILGMADLPLLISIKMKFLFDTASLYGFEVKDYRERIYILYIFQLAFSSDARRIEIYRLISSWDIYVKTMPISQEDFDWREFQQEYRDYIDLAKLLQLIPGIGAVVGAYANYKLMDKLGETAINSYRLRLVDKEIF